MLKLLKKDLRLALHPTCILFLPLSGMLLIPNYPYYVVFFYTTLGIFFTCLTGRENKDIVFSAMLPVRKTDIVNARIALALIAELAQMAVAVPFAVLRSAIGGANMAGMDANTALFGMSFIMLGLFNLVFFTGYYKNPDRIGMPFLRGCIVTFLFIGAAEAAAATLPFFCDRLDTPDPAFMTEKLLLLAAGAVLFALLTALAAHLSRRRFARLDL